MYEISGLVVTFKLYDLLNLVPSYCNFEDEKICGWNQDTTDEADWTRHRSHTSSQFTGPVVDHTEQSPEGTL